MGYFSRLLLILSEISAKPFALAEKNRTSAVYHTDIMQIQSLHTAAVHRYYFDSASLYIVKYTVRHLNIPEIPHGLRTDFKSCPPCRHPASGDENLFTGFPSCRFQAYGVISCIQTAVSDFDHAAAVNVYPVIVAIAPVSHLHFLQNHITALLQMKAPGS